MIIKAIFYVDYGKGYSVKEVIDTIKRVTKKDFKVELQGRRAGDLACLISNNSKIISKMRWCLNMMI